MTTAGGSDFGARAGLLPSLVIFAGASIWGIYWIPVRELEAMGVASGWAVAIFNAPALLVAAVVLFCSPRPTPRLNRLSALGGAFAGLGLAFYAVGLVETTVVRATLLFYLTPVWGTLFAMALLGERPGAARWIALALALAGLALTLGATPADIVGAVGPGEAFGLASGAVWALAAVVIRKIGDEGSSATNARIVLHQYVWVMIGAAGAAAALGASAPDPATALAGLSPFVVIVSGLMLLSIYAIFWAVGRVSPGRSGLLMMSEAIVAVITAGILLPEEALSPREWFGAALIVGAALVEVLGGAERA